MDFTNYDYLEIAGTLIGLIYLYFEYNANRLVWIAGIIMPAIHTKRFALYSKYRYISPIRVPAISR